MLRRFLRRGIPESVHILYRFLSPQVCSRGGYEGDQSVSELCRRIFCDVRHWSVEHWRISAPVAFRAAAQVDDHASSGPEEGKAGASLAGGSSLAIASSSQLKGAAWKLVEYLSEPTQQLAFYRLTGDLPARVEAWQDTTFTNNPYTRAFYTQLKTVMAPPKSPSMGTDRGEATGLC